MGASWTRPPDGDGVKSMAEQVVLIADGDSARRRMLREAFETHFAVTVDEMTTKLEVKELIRNRPADLVTLTLIVLSDNLISNSTEMVRTIQLLVEISLGPIS